MVQIFPFQSNKIRRRTGLTNLRVDLNTWIFVLFSTLSKCQIFEQIKSHSTKTQFEFRNMKSFQKDISSLSSMQNREKHVSKHESEMRFNRFLWKSVENTQFRNARSNPVQRNKLKSRFLQNLSALRFRIDFLKKQKKLQTHKCGEIFRNFVYIANDTTLSITSVEVLKSRCMRILYSSSENLRQYRGHVHKE